MLRSRLQGERGWRAARRVLPCLSHPAARAPIFRSSFPGFPPPGEVGQVPADSSGARELIKPVCSAGLSARSPGPRRSPLFHGAG
jgi:hypothetical protein